MHLRRALSNRLGRPSQYDEVPEERPPSSHKSKDVRRQLLSQTVRNTANDYLRPEIWADKPRTSIKTCQAIALVKVLRLEPSTPHLTTICAGLGKPLVRATSTPIPPEFCSVHTWLNPQHPLLLSELVAKELHYRSEGLFKYPKKYLGQEVKDILCILWPYREVFKPRFMDDTDVIRVRSAADAFKNKPIDSERDCVACKLSALFQDELAVAALATLCKGRKHHHHEWPELLAYLEPVVRGEDDQWRRRFVREGHAVRKVRRNIRAWRARGGETDGSAEESGVEVPICYTPTELKETYPKQEHSEGDLSGTTVKEEKPEHRCDDQSAYKKHPQCDEDDAEASDDDDWDEESSNLPREYYGRSKYANADTHADAYLPSSRYGEASTASPTLEELSEARAKAYNFLVGSHPYR